jgi:hypothetical protein
MRRLGKAVASAGALALLLATACTSDPDEPSSGGGGAGGDGSGDQAESSTEGLSDDAIKIGVIGADFGQLAQAGLAPDLGDQPKIVQSIVDEINAAGGIGGRQVELRLTLIDGTGGAEAGQAACIEMTQDFGAFAVILTPAIGRDVARCTAVTNETLTLGATGFDEALYDEAGGWPFTTGSDTSMSTDRQFAGWAQMKDAGVDFVFMAAANLTGPTFVQAAENLDFHPQWAANGNQVTDTVSQFFDSVKDAWDGAVGTSTVFALVDDLTDEARACNDAVTEHSGEDYEPGSDAFGFAAVVCLDVRALDQAGDAVDPADLDQAAVIGGIEALGEVALNAGPPGSLSADAAPLPPSTERSPA